MKIGSIVECVQPNQRELTEIEALVGLKTPKVGKPYTVREFTVDRSGKPHIRLEEIVNPRLLYMGRYVEVCFCLSRFRELISPDEISIEDLLEEVITK